MDEFKDLAYPAAYYDEAARFRHQHDNANSLSRVGGTTEPTWNGNPWPGGEVGGIPEAPEDGTLYGRKNKEWEPVPEVPTAAAELLFFGVEDGAPVATHAEPTEAQTIMAMRSIPANPGVWTDVMPVPFTLSESLYGTEFEFIPDNTFKAVFWARSNLARNGALFRLRATDILTGESLALGTASVDLGNQGILQPIIIQGIYETPSIVLAENIRMTLQVQSPLFEVQMGLFSIPPNEKSYIARLISGASGVTEHSQLTGLGYDESGHTGFASLAQIEILLQLHNRIYLGVDLREKFDKEIFNSYPTEWDWVRDRIDMGFYKGMLVSDYIPLTLTDGKTFKMDIAGIDTYYNYGDTVAKHHIDFISRNCHPDAYQWNKADYNNGTSVSPISWSASDLYARINSLAMDVPSGMGTGGTPLVAVDYTTTGVFDKLPIALKNVIVTKRVLLPRRYTSGSVLKDDNGWSWVDAGKLWLPSEMEVYGTNMWGSLVSATPGYSISGFQQYPIFAQNMNRIKSPTDGGATRTYWWLLSARGGSSEHCAVVYYNGNADFSNASSSANRIPLCYRIGSYVYSS